MVKCAGPLPRIFYLVLSGATNYFSLGVVDSSSVITKK